MIKFENTEVVGWKAAIRGMRNPMNSWDKSDSYENYEVDMEGGYEIRTPYFRVGSADLDLMKRLRNVGTDHRKFMRMITVYVDITAPLYWWKEFDTYKVGTVENSCSTMHRLTNKPFEMSDFSHEHLNEDVIESPFNKIIDYLNFFRELYLQNKDKSDWWQIIQILPSSYNQKRTVMLNYEVLANIYKSRKDHKLDEWRKHEPEWEFDVLKISDYSFCDWIETLPYSELITGEN